VRDNRGFTLIELAIALAIFGMLLVGLFAALASATILSDAATSKAAALAATVSKLEEIIATDRDRLIADYSTGGAPGPLFAVAGLPHSQGVVALDTSEAGLITVHCTVCWRGKGNRLYGEDADLDGVRDPGEDANGNGFIDSPVTLSVTLVR